MSVVGKDLVPSASLTVSPHSWIAKTFHWGFIVVFAYRLAKQVDEVEELEETAFLVEEMVFAVVFLVLLLARFVYMQTTRPTVLPARTPKSMSRLARFVHLGMYASLAMLAVTGLVIGSMFTSGMKESTMFTIVLWSHEAFYWASLNLIGLHIAGALYHRHLRDGVWSAMMPVLKTRAGDRAR